MTQAFVDGLLLEGLNYSGKTTMARLVEEELAAAGASVSGRHCYLCPDPDVESLQKRSFGGVELTGRPAFPDPELLRPFNAYRSAQILIDSQVAEGTDWDGLLVVQDRHWLSQMCNNEFFTPGEGFLSRTWARRHAPRFSVQLYFTCSQQVREQRAARRPAVESHALNTYLRSHVTELDRFENRCLELVSEIGGFEVVRTDDLDLQAYASEVAGRLLTTDPDRMAAREFS